MVSSLDAFKCTRNSANPTFKSPYEMYFGKQAPLQLLPFLVPEFDKTKRTSKDQENVVPCSSIGPAKNHPYGTARFLVKGT